MLKKIPIFLTAALLIATVVFGYIGYQQKQKSYELEAKKGREGQIPKKKLQIEPYSAMDIRQKFITFVDATFSLYMEGKELKNLYSITYTIKNTGEAPILESDFSENLTLTFPERWKILFLKNSRIVPPEFNPVWEKINNHKIQLKPLLINAGDRFGLEIFLFDTEMAKPKTFEVRKELQGSWTVRIPKLNKIDIKDPYALISEPKEPITKLERNKMLKELFEKMYIDRFGGGLNTLFKAGFIVMPYKWGVYAILALGAIMIFIYLNLLYPLKEHFNLGKQSSIFSIIGVSVFSFAASETYITFFTQLGKNVPLINYIFMFLFVVSIIILVKINGRVTIKIPEGRI